MILEDLKFCQVCDSINLKLEENFCYETIHYNEVDEKEVMGTVKHCLDCGGIYFVEDDRLCYQFIRKEEQFVFNRMVSNNELYLQE